MHNVFILGLCISSRAITLNAQTEQAIVNPDIIPAGIREVRPDAEPTPQQEPPIQYYSPDDEAHLRLFAKYLNENDFDNARLHALQIKENNWQLELLDKNEAIYMNSSPEDRELGQSVKGVHRLALEGKYAEARDLANQVENDNSRKSLLELVDQVERQQKSVQQGGPGYPPQGVGSPDP